MLNKLDLVPEEERKALVSKIHRSLRWRGPWFAISALSGEGADALTRAVMERLEELQRAKAVAAEREAPAAAMEDEAGDVQQDA